MSYLRLPMCMHISFYANRYNSVIMYQKKITYSYYSFIKVKNVFPFSMSIIWMLGSIFHMSYSSHLPMYV